MAGQDTGIVSGIMRTLVSDKPDLEVQRLIRDPQMEDLWRTGFDQYYRDSTQSNRNLRNFSRLFQRNYPGIRDRELGSISRYYDGGIESELAALRGNENNLFNAALERGLGGLDRGFGASAVAGGYSPRSSYGQRIREGARTDLMLQNALRQSGQERSDFSNLEAAKLGLLGRTIPIMQASLIPSQLKSANYGRLAGMRAQQLATDPGMYNVWRRRGDMERAADIMDSLAEGAYKGLNAFMSFGGLGGGGGMGGMSGMMGGGGGGMAGANSDMGGNARANWSADFLNSNRGSGGMSGMNTPTTPAYQPGGNQFNDWWNSSQGGY